MTTDSFSISAHMWATQIQGFSCSGVQKPTQKNTQFFFLKGTDDPRIAFGRTVRCEGTGSIIGLIRHMANAVLLGKKMQTMAMEPGTNQGTI